MSAVKSIRAVDDRLTEIVKEMAEEFARQHPSHQLSLEANVLWDTKRKLSAINGADTPLRVKSEVLTRVRSAKGKQPKGRVSQMEAAAAAVRAIGHPLTTAELVIALPEYGAVPSAKNAEANLTSIMSKRGELKSIRWRDKRAWWFKDQETPE